MKKYRIQLHLLGIFLLYFAVGIAIYWIFTIEVPFGEPGVLAMPIAFGVIFILPVIGFISIKMHSGVLNKSLGYLYMVFWLIAVVRFFTLFN